MTNSSSWTKRSVRTGAIEWWANRILAAPTIFDFSQWLAGAPDCHARFISEMVQPARGERILDIGCGVGASVKFLPDGVDYVGIDVSGPYIETARTRHGKRGTFICSDVSLLDSSNIGTFDRAFSFGVLHHLSDSVAASAIDLVRRVVRPGGMFATIDPCFVPGQSPIARFLISHDRGKYVRDQQGFERLVSDLGTVQSRVFHNLLRHPSTQLVMQVTLNA
jgi:SAM-dependent methyltransferase